MLAGARHPVQRELPVHRSRDRRAVPHARHAWRRLRARTRATAPRRARRARSAIDVLVELDDGSDEASIPGAVDFETIVAAGGHVDDDTSPDDIYIACTGGTTGRPKAVLWRQGDLYVAAIGGSDDADEATIRARAEAGAGVWFPTSPLMHVAAQWTVFLAASMGATVVLHDDRKRFDAPTILATAARERANMMTIIGDAYARPLDRRAPTHALRPLGAGRARHRRDARRAGRPRTRSPSCCRASPSATATARRRSA